MSGTTDSSVNSTSEITFFYTGNAGGIVREIFEPIASEAKSRGYNITYTTDFNKHADIGFYCEHDHVIPQVNSDLSIITFHGLDDSFNKRYYINENWRQYDIGLLPGQVAAEKWQSVSWHPSAKPQIGMYQAGWPKADHLFTDEFETLTRAKTKKYGVQSGRTVLYAPTLESDNKVIEFIESSEGIFDNILIKLAPYDDADLSEIIDEHHGERTVLEKTTGIMEALTLADVVVSEQSSVLIEALLTDTIPVSVIDWPIRWGDSPSYPGKTLPAFALQTNSNELTRVLQSIKQDYDSYIDELSKERKKNFDNLGTSASAVMDIIDSHTRSSTPSSKPIKIKPTRWRPDKKILKREIVHQLAQLKSSIDSTF